MKRTLIALACLTLATQAQAEIIGSVQTQDGRIEVHKETGQCVGQARRAEFVHSHGARIPGCWVLLPDGVIQVAFMDGDVVQFQVQPQPRRPGLTL